MPQHSTADSRFTQLDQKRTSMVGRLEHYSGLTLPYIFPPEPYEEGDWELRNDHHSVGAQAVNHLANKIMIGLFQPGFPFFKLDIPEDMRSAMVAEGVDTKTVDHSLAQGEKSAIRQMAKIGIRPSLFEAVKQLIILGNALPVFHKKDDFELVNFRDWVIRRSRTGNVLELIVRSCTTVGELEESAQEVVTKSGINPDPDTKVKHYYWIKRKPSGEYTVTQWVDRLQLPSKFDSKYKDYDELPWQPQAWVLPAKHHYGVGLVEEYVGDLTAITEFAESLVDGAALASVWRLLINPSSTLRPEDLAEGENGDALPGEQGAVSVFQANTSQGLSVVQAIQADVIQRFSRGFLLMSSVTRDAERVTAAEIRTLANELETGLGGVYSRLANSFQGPLAGYLLRKADLSIDGTKITPVIVTGFDALSRAAELERVQLFLQDVANITSLPDVVADWLKVGPILKSLAANRHLDADEYVNNEQEVTAVRQQRVEQQAALAQATQPQGGEPQQ